MGVKEEGSHLLREKGPKKMCSFIFTWKEGFHFGDGNGDIQGRGSS